MNIEQTPIPAHRPQDFHLIAALDDADELGLDLLDPFAPGWHEWDFGPEARETIALS